ASILFLASITWPPLITMSYDCAQTDKKEKQKRENSKQYLFFICIIFLKPGLTKFILGGVINRLFSNNLLSNKTIKVYIFYHSFNSTIISISTAIFFGREHIPTAERACLPFSPNTSTKRSEHPLITCGCCSKVGIAFTIPSTFTIRFTLLRSPICAFSVDSSEIPVNLAAS